VPITKNNCSDHKKNLLSSLNKNKKLIFWVIIILLLFTGTWLRFYKLNQLPFGLNKIESHNAIRAIDFSDENESFIKNNSFTYISEHLTLLSFDFFGINIFALRFISSILGTLTLLGFIFLLKELKFSRRLIPLGTFFLAFSFWHISLSRNGQIDALIPFLIIVISTLLLRGINNKKYLQFSVAGILLGTSTWLHHLGIVISIPIIFSLLCFITLNKKNFSTLRYKFLIFILLTLFFSIPLFLQLKQNPELLIETYKTNLGIEKTNLLNFQSIITCISSVFYTGDFNQTNNPLRLPLIPFAWSILFILGLIISFKELFVLFFKRKSFIPKNILAILFSFSNILAMIFLLLLSKNTFLSSKNLILIIPSILVLCLIPFEYFSQVYQKLKLSNRLYMKKWRWKIIQASLLGILVSILISGFSQIHLYFQIWPNSNEAKIVFQKKELTFGKIIKSIERKKNNFIILPQSVIDSKRNSIANIDAIRFIGFPEIKHYQFLNQEEGTNQTHCKESLFVFYEIDDFMRKQFQKKCPENKFQEISSYNEKEVFWTMKE